MRAHSHFLKEKSKGPPYNLFNSMSLLIHGTTSSPVDTLLLTVYSFILFFGSRGKKWGFQIFRVIAGYDLVCSVQLKLSHLYAYFVLVSKESYRWFVGTNLESIIVDVRGREHWYHLFRWFFSPFNTFT